MEFPIPVGFVVMDVWFGKYEDYVPKFHIRDGYVEVPASAGYEKTDNTTTDQAGKITKASMKRLQNLVGVHKKTDIHAHGGGTEPGVHIPIKTWNDVMLATPDDAEPRFTFAAPEDADAWCRRMGIPDMRAHVLSKLALHGWNVNDNDCDCGCNECCKGRKIVKQRANFYKTLS